MPLYFKKDDTVTTRLGEKLGLIDVTAERWVLLKQLFGVIDIDALLRDSKADTKAGTGTDRIDTYTVLAKKRWRLLAAAFARANTGACNMSAVIDGKTVDVDRHATATSGTFKIYNPITLAQGDTISFSFSTGTSGNMASYIIYEEEDAF